MFKIGDYLTPETYTAGAIWATANNAVINPFTWQIEAKPELTKEELSALREEAYKKEVDPITCHIQRLKDESSITAELNAEIASLVEERKARVAEIKARYPYPVVTEEQVVEELETLVEDYSNAE